MAYQTVFQIFLPAFLLVALWRGAFSNRLDWLLNVLAVSAFCLVVFLTARWDFTSYYLRLALPFLIAAVAYRSYQRANWSQGEHRKEKLSAVLTNAVFVVVCSGLSLFALSGYGAPEGAIQLAYPLRDGTYYIGGGGNNRFINNHQAHEPQKFALDIVRLNAFGNRASGLAPDDPERYAIFGDTVYSPCSGAVIRAMDGLPDLRPPDKDPDNIAGNHIVLACGGVKVVLAHLKQGSVAVTPDMRVNQGSVLGQVGNSGNTSQPHLHLHAERGGEPGQILTGEGVPIELGGRFLVRNSLFHGR